MAIKFSFSSNFDYMCIHGINACEMTQFLHRNILIHRLYMNILYSIPLTVKFCSVSFLQANPTHEISSSHRAQKGTDHTQFNHFPIGHVF